MACQVYRNRKTGEIDKVVASNKEESLLFKDLVSLYGGNKENALKAWAWTYTPTFKKNYYGNKDVNGEPTVASLRVVLKGGKKDPKLREKYFSEGEETNHVEVLKKIKEQGHSLSPLVDKLLELSKDIPLMKVKLEPTQTVDGGAGVYFLARNEIKIAEFGNFKFSSEVTLIHEILHGLTKRTLDENKELRAKFEELYNHTLANKDKFRDTYPLENVDEFIVGIYSNAYFIQDLSRMDSIKEEANFMRDILEFFKELFNFSPTERTLFDDAMEAANEILESYTMPTFPSQEYIESMEQEYVFIPEEDMVTVVENTVGIRNKDGSRKRYTNENKAISIARKLNKEHKGFQFKVIKVMGEKGDKRVYWAVQANERFYASPVAMTEQESKNLSYKIKSIDKTFQGLNYLKAGQAIAAMINHVGVKAFDGKVEIDKELEAYREELMGELATYQSIPLDKVNNRKQRQIKVLINNYQATLDNFDELAKIAKKELRNDDRYKMEKTTKAEEEADEKGERYDVQTYEIDPKSNITTTMKRILGGFTRPKKNYLNKQEYVPFDEAFNSLLAILAGQPHNLDAVIEQMELHVESRPWLTQAIKRIKNLPPQLQNQFLSRMIMAKMEMKYVTLKQTHRGFELHTINTNRNDIGTAIQNEWKNNLKQTGLFIPSNGSYRVNHSALEELKMLANKESPTIDDLDKFLRAFGVELAPQALASINQYGFAGKNLEKHFKDKGGIVKILLIETSNMQKKSTYLADRNPLNQSMISKLAYLESRFNKKTYLTPNTFRTGGKQIFSYTQHTMTSDRVKELLNGTVIKDLQNSAFTKNSHYLTLLDPENMSKTAVEFRERFIVFDADLNSFETNIIGNKQKAEGFTSLAEAEHELARLGFFFNNNSKHADGQRAAKFIFPTMSDKTRVHIMEGISVSLTGKDGAELLYDRIAKAEIDRILTHQDRDIKGYNDGARLINLFPALNSVLIDEEKNLTLFEFLNTHKAAANKESGQKLIKEKLLPKLRELIEKEKDKKREKWKKLGIEQYVPGSKIKGKDVTINEGFLEEFVVNNMLNMGEVFQLFIGDPAMFFKTNVIRDIMKYDELTLAQQEQISKDTFINVGKRLAMLIAPGTKLADNENNRYKQLFLKDRKSASIAYDYLVKVLGEDLASAYAAGEIEGADAQEYVTWQEHLYVLEKLGEIQPFVTSEGRELTKEDLDEARKMFESEKTYDELSDKQKELLNNIMQVMKPVYTGQVHKDGVQQVVYIKSSAFPLIPQLTQGMEIDRLRVAMEELQKKTMNTQGGLNGTVRATFGSAAKVGFNNNPLNIWNDDGTIRNDISLQEVEASTIELTRNNFRIQQSVPFKSSKKDSQDKVNIGSQERKLLFANFFGMDNFEFQGKKYSAVELYDKYNDLYDKLFQLNLNNLYEELGIDPTSNKPIAEQLSVQTLAKLLKKEAETRNYPIGDIRGLQVRNGEFVLPLWLHQSSDRYESLLNSIVSNRVIGLKMPGYTYVLGSEEGFKDKKIYEYDDFDASFKSRIVFTDSWEGELKPSRFVLKSTGETITESIDSYHPDDIEFRPSQVIAPMKFRDTNGKLINLMEKEGKDYKYIEETKRGFRLKQGVFDKETLKLFGFRIPTSAPFSMASIEIVGFTPMSSGDVIIASRDFTIQMGSDFDVDKLTTYMYNTKLVDGKLIKDNSTEEMQLQNDIIELHHAVFSHKSDFVQSQIHTPLSFDYAAEIGNDIDNKRVGEEVGFFTPLSDEYQKAKMLSGSAGKAGTGVYSLDVVFHANCQALKAKGTPIYLTSKAGDYELVIAGMKAHRELGETKTVVPTNSEVAINFLQQIEKRTAEETELLNQLSQGYDTAVDLFEEMYPGVIETELADFRFISDALSEAQNYSVDNEKEQIMGKVNDNEITFNARKVLNGFGLDKSFKKVNTIDGKSKRFSIPNLFMAQTVLMDGLAPMAKDKSSSLAAYDPDVLGTVRQELMTDLLNNNVKYDVNDVDSLVATMTEQEMYDMVGVPFNEMTPRQLTLQAAILDKFIELDEIGLQINSIQTSINTDSKKLGKSLFDNLTTLDKVIKLQKKVVALGDLPFQFRNAEQLIGDYAKEPVDSSYRKITDELYIKPTTVNGFATIHGLVTAADMYQKVYPFTAPQFNTVAKELGKVLGRDETSTQLRQDLLKTLKSFVYSSAVTQKLDKSVDATRKELFIDSPSNQSLASYLQQALEDNPKLRNYAILNSMNLVIESNGLPSTINWNNSATNEFEDQFYLSFLGMLENTSPLKGEYNGKQMTVQSLAQNLITYAYLEGGIQQATQFIRHIPSEYLDAFGLANNLREVDLNKHSTYGKDTTKLKDKTYVADIIRQYMQHNPRKAQGVEIPKEKKTKEQKEESDAPTVLFVDKEKGEELEFNSKFVVDFDKERFVKGVKNSGLTLYEFKNGKYGAGWYAIPILGVSGMSEYNFDKPGQIQESMIHYNPEQTETLPMPQGEKYKPQFTFKEMFNLEQTSAKEILKSPGFMWAEFDSLIQEYLNVDKDFEVIIYPGYDFEGGYKNGKIYLSQGFLKDVEKGVVDEAYFRRVFMEEYTHALTKDALMNPTKDQKAIVERIIRYYNRARKAIAKEFGEDKLKELEDRFKPDSDSPKGLTDEERAFIYGGINVVEFVGHIITNSEFQGMLNQVKLTKDGETQGFWQTIKKLLQDLIMNIINVPNIDENSLTYAAVGDVLNLINTQKKDSFDGYVEEVKDKLTEQEYMYQKLVVEEGMSEEEFSQLLSMDLKDFDKEEFNREDTQEYLKEGFPNLSKDEIEAILDRELPLEDTARLAESVTEMKENGASVQETMEIITLEFLEESAKESEEAFPDDYLQLANEIQKEIEEESDNFLSFTKEVQDEIEAKAVEQIENKQAPRSNMKEREYTLPNGVTIYFNDQQWEGLKKIKDFLDSREIAFTLSGYAGTGKTTIIKKILDSYRGKVVVSAPTHKAKKVVMATTKKKGATIQSLLGLRPNVDLAKFDPNNPVFAPKGEKQIEFYNLVILDEASMLNSKLFTTLMKEAKDAGAKVIFMGDIAQIPPVGEVESQVFNKVTNMHQLTHVERTAADNPLMKIFDSIRDNLNSEVDKYAHISAYNGVGHGVEFTDEAARFKEQIFEWFSSPEFQKDLNYAKLVTYTNDSVAQWNDIIRSKIIDSNEIIATGDVLMAYDTIQLNKYANLIENSQDYRVKHVGEKTFKGFKSVDRNIGNISYEGFYVTMDNDQEVFIINHNNEENILAFKEEYFRRLNLGKSGRGWIPYYELKREFMTMTDLVHKGQKFKKTLDYGYAVTAHKAQGSTYKKVAINEDNMEKNSKTRERNQIKYVAFSRASENVISKSSKAGKDVELAVEDMELPEAIPFDPEIGLEIPGLDMSPFRVDDFRRSLSDEDRKLFNRLKREGVIKTKCK